MCEIEIRMATILMIRDIEKFLAEVAEEEGW
jgi:hypothetical protein